MFHHLSVTFVFICSLVCNQSVKCSSVKQHILSRHYVHGIGRSFSSFRFLKSKKQPFLSWLFLGTFLEFFQDIVRNFLDYVLLQLFKNFHSCTHILMTLLWHSGDTITDAMTYLSIIGIFHLLITHFCTVLKNTNNTMNGKVCITQNYSVFIKTWTHSGRHCSLLWSILSLFR